MEIKSTATPKNSWWVKNKEFIISTFIFTTILISMIIIMPQHFGRLFWIELIVSAILLMVGAYNNLKDVFYFSIYTTTIVATVLLIGSSYKTVSDTTDLKPYIKTVEWKGKPENMFVVSLKEPFNSNETKVTFSGCSSKEKKFNKVFTTVKGRNDFNIQMTKTCYKSLIDDLTNSYDCDIHFEVKSKYDNDLDYSIKITDIIYPKKLSFKNGEQ